MSTVGLSPYQLGKRGPNSTVIICQKCLDPCFVYGHRQSFHKSTFIVFRPRCPSTQNGLLGLHPSRPRPTRTRIRLQSGRGVVSSKSPPSHPKTPVSQWSLCPTCHSSLFNNSWIPSLVPLSRISSLRVIFELVILHFLLYPGHNGLTSINPVPSRKQRTV